MEEKLIYSRDWKIFQRSLKLLEKFTKILSKFMCLLRPKDFGRIIVKKKCHYEDPFDL